MGVIRSLVWVMWLGCHGLRAEPNAPRSGVGPEIGDLPTAAQQGPSCAFFANLPLVAWTTGYDVGSSPGFMCSVYGLRRGDFTFQRAFDKRIFCELFSFRYKEVEFKHPAAVEGKLLPAAEAIIIGHFDKALSKGRLFSIRVKGIFGGAHNALLIGRKGENYLVHDPRGGRMLSLSRRQLARWMLVRAAADRRSVKPRHVTHFLEVEVPLAPVAKVMPVSAFAHQLQIGLSATERKALALCLGLDERRVAGDAAQLVKTCTAVDFAVMDDEQGGLRSVISADLAADRMVGVLHLSQLALNACHRGTRRLLPVLVLEGRPHVLTGYRSNSDNLLLAQWTLDDGNAVATISSKHLLERFKRSGALYGALPLAPLLHDRPASARAGQP